MILQPDEPARRGDAAGEPADEHQDTPAPVHATRWSAEPTEEPVWVVPSIVLALVVLSGSVLLFAVVVVIGLVLWPLSMPPLEEDGEDGGEDGEPFRYPFGGPGLLR